MSDFGTTISVTRKDNNVLTDSELNTLSAHLKTLIKNANYVDLEGEPFNHEFDNLESEGLVQLTEYYFGEDDPEEDMEFVKEEELPDAKALVSELKSEFPEYDFKASVEDW